MQKNRAPSFPHLSRGCLWMPLVIGGLVVLGCFVVTVYQISAFSQLQRYQAGRCTITAKQLDQREVHLGSADQETEYIPDFHFIVQTADGHRYQAQGYDAVPLLSADQASQQAIVDQYVMGRTYPCWYNPADLTQAVLTRQFNWGAVAFTGACFIFALFWVLFVGAMVLSSKPVD